MIYKTSRHAGRLRSRAGFSLLEIVAAVVITSMLAVAGFSMMSGRSDVAHSRTCQGHRVSLQSQVELYQQETGRWPDSSMTNITNSDYAGKTLPRCPVAAKTGGSNYLLRSGKVTCQYHPDN